MSSQRRSRHSDRELGRELRRLYAEGLDAFGLALGDADFEVAARDRLARRLRRAQVPVDDAALLWVAQLTFGADLFLAVACERNIPGAWERLIRLHSDRLRAVLVRHGASPADAHEIVADLPGHLLAARAPPDGRARIAGYLGTGRLVSWLATIALRRLARRKRGLLHPHGLLFDVRAAEGGPALPADLLAVAGELRSAFGDALADVLAAMPRRERLALRFRFTDGLSLREIAVLFGVGVPRASRIVEAAVQRLRRVMRARLPDSVWPDDRHGFESLRDELALQLRRVSVGALVPQRRVR